LAEDRRLKPCPLCGSTAASWERTLNSIELLRCVECDFVYANLDDRAIEEANFGFDEKWTLTYEEYQTWIDKAWFESVARRITTMARVGRALDIGCGNGELLRQLMKYGWRAEGADPSPWAPQFAQRWGYTLHPTTVEEAGLPSNSFDAITSTSTLEHVANPTAHVREIMRIVKPGGLAYFAGIPNYGSAAVRLGVSTFESNVPPEHVNYFTRRTLMRLFSTGELRHVASRLSVNTYGIPELHRAYYATQEAL